MTRNFDAHRLAAIVEALPRCVIDRDELGAGIIEIAERYRFRVAMRRELQDMDGKKVKQALAALRKFERLFNDEAVLSAVREYRCRRVKGADDSRINTSFVMDEAIALLMPDLEGAAAMCAAERGGFHGMPDLRRDTPMHGLVTELGNLYAEAIDEPFTQPTYDPVHATIGGPFVLFFRLATIEAFNGFGRAHDALLRTDPPSDEALRARIREAVELGDIAPKKSSRHLWRDREIAANSSATEMPKQKVADDDSKTPGRIGGGDPRKRGRGRQASHGRARGAGDR